MKYLLKAVGSDREIVIDGDALHGFIDAAIAYDAADANLPDGVPYDVDAAVEVASKSAYVARRLFSLVQEDVNA